MELSGIELRYLVNEIRAKVTSGYYVSDINSTRARWNQGKMKIYGAIFL